MSIKQGVMMGDSKKGLVQDLRSRAVEFRKKVLRLYLQYINPKLGRAVEAANQPGDFFRKLFPFDIAKWVTIAAAITGFLVMINPETFWYWQLVVFISVFFVGPVVMRFLAMLKANFYNLLVAYPGKHLLGTDFSLDKAIVDGLTEMELHGEQWAISGDDCPAGTYVRVIAIKEGVLFVTPVENEN